MAVSKKRAATAKAEVDTAKVVSAPAESVVAKDNGDELIKVQAVLPEGKIGFIGERGSKVHRKRKDGEKFVIPRRLFSEKWMKEIGGDIPNEVVNDDFVDAEPFDEVVD